MNRKEFLKLAAAAGLSAFLLPGCSTAPIPAQPAKRTPGDGAGGGTAPSAASSSVEPFFVIAEGTDPMAMLDRGLAACGGIERFVRPGNLVVIKPNFSVPRTPDIAATTSSILVAALVRRCLRAKAAEVRVIDHTFTSGPMCLEATQIRREVEAAGGKAYVINTLNDKFYRPVDLHGTILREAQYSRDVLEADTFINFPILKHHNGTELTMGLKNIMGLVWDRGIFHRTDLHRTIAEAAAFKKPHLTILDATRGITDNGPMGPGPIREWNRLVFSNDPVAVDAYGAHLFGLKPSSVGYIPIAAGLGAGRMDWEKLSVNNA